MSKQNFFFLSDFGQIWSQKFGHEKFASVEITFCISFVQQANDARETKLTNKINVVGRVES